MILKKLKKLLIMNEIGQSFFFFVVVPKWAFIVIESQLLPINLIYYTRLSISSTKKCLIQNNVVY